MRVCSTEQQLPADRQGGADFRRYRFFIFKTIWNLSASSWRLLKLSVGHERRGRSRVGRKVFISYSHNSLRKGLGKERNGLLGIHIPNKRHWIPPRLQRNEHMGLISTWPRNYRTLANQIEVAYQARNNMPDLRGPLRQRNSMR